MSAGSLDRRIVLSHRDLQANEHGEQIPIYEEYATVWARKSDLNGREFFAAAQIQSEITTKFRIRWRGDVVDTDRLSLDDVDYNIKSSAEVGRREWLDIFCSSI
jgi:SPP1 family predicted phage head-tail adaptor